MGSEDEGAGIIVPSHVQEELQPLMRTLYDQLSNLKKYEGSFSPDQKEQLQVRGMLQCLQMVRQETCGPLLCAPSVWVELRPKPILSTFVSSCIP